MPADERGQATIAGLIAVVVVVAVAVGVAAVAAVAAVRGDAQRAADLTALAAARALHDGYRTGGGLRDGDGGMPPAVAAARRAAYATARANGATLATVRFPGRGALPATVAVRVAVPLHILGRRFTLPATASAGPAPSYAGDGGDVPAGQYAGRLARRQGKPMRPDVALAFDRMAAAARRDGFRLMIASAFRTDAEQALLFAAHPDPKWVAPPGRSLHRLGTELDLGPPAAYRWLAVNGARFGFRVRYAWEPWHLGYTRSAGSRSVGYGPREGAPALPAFVPARYAPPIVRAAQRWNVGAALLAAQIRQESGFDPLARSPAGAGGISQFMPRTAARYGLTPAERFDPAKAIMAQAHHMHDLLAEFGAVPLALAAYNAGPQAVRRCGCIPAYPETQAYVAAIMALLAGAGEADPGYSVDVRLLS